jgi:hypothetical protein
VLIGANGSNQASVPRTSTSRTFETDRDLQKL